MAKLCSSFKKPRAQTILRTSALPHFLPDTQFRKVSHLAICVVLAKLTPFFRSQIRLLGGKLGEAIATDFGANLVSDLLSAPLFFRSYHTQTYPHSA